MTDITKGHYIGFIFNQRHEIHITSPLNILEETFLSHPKLFVKKMHEPWMNSNTLVVSKVSKVHVWNQHGQKMEQMCNRRENKNNIFSYVSFSRL